MSLDSLYVYNTYEEPIVNEFAHLAICIADIEIPKNGLNDCIIYLHEKTSPYRNYWTDNKL